MTNEQLINKHYPPFSKERRALRGFWNREACLSEGKVCWNDYLLSAAIKKEQAAATNLHPIFSQILKPFMP